MNFLRHNLLHALLAFGLLVAMVSASRPETRLVATRQIVRATHIAAVAVCNLSGANCTRRSTIHIDSASALKQAVHELLGSLDR